MSQFLKIKKTLRHRPFLLFRALRVLLVLNLVSLFFSYNAAAQAHKTGRLEISVIDDLTDQKTPVRVRLTRGAHAVEMLPDSAVAVMYGVWDHADGFGFQPDSSFYVNGYFKIDLPPGKYSLSLLKGNEYIGQKHELIVPEGISLKKTFRLKRWISMAEKGWYSADGHIHIRRSPREDPLIMNWTRAEDINVGVLLKMGDFWETYFAQYAWGEKGVYQRGKYLLTAGQEDPRTPELGHALGMGASESVRFKKEYYYYDKVFDRLHELGGVAGYAHQAETFHGYRGLTLDALRGKIDVLELLQFCASSIEPLQVQHYYHLLDLGIATTAVAGSDFPWCGNNHDKGPIERFSRIGNARFYTYLDGPLTYQNWKKGIASGHTFVSSGPVIDFKVNGHIPGDTLRLKKGDQIQIEAMAFGHSSEVPLKSLEIIAHGKVIRRLSSEEINQSQGRISIKLTLPAEKGMWIAARCYAKQGQAAHTTPVYVTVDGGGFHNPETAPHYLNLSEKYLQELEKEIEHEHPEADHQAWKYREGLEKRIAETRQVIELLKMKLK